MSRISFVRPDRAVRIFKLLNSKPVTSNGDVRNALKACQSALLLLMVLVFPAALAQAQANFGLQPVGVASGSQNVTVTASAAGTVATVRVLTLGVEDLDFAPGSGATTCTSAPLGVGTTCVQSVIFTPSAPGLRPGAIVLLDQNGNILATTPIFGTGQGGLGVLVPGNVAPIVNLLDNYLGTVRDGGPALNAELYLPGGVTIDGAGNMYIADTNHHRIRMVCGGVAATIKGTSCSPAQLNIINTIVGNGNPAYTGDGQPAGPNTTVSSPQNVALDGAGNLYIADTGNNAVRVLWAATGIVTTIAGNGIQGDGGDGGPATIATLNAPSGVTIDAQGNIFIADTSNHRIRMMCAVAPGTPIFGTACPPAAADITTVAGTGMINGNGSGGFSGDGGPATQADLNFPYAVAFDAAGNMYIPDQENNVVRIVNPSGTITTFAGTGGSHGYAGDGQPATSALLWGPTGVAIDPAGNVYFADTQNNAIRKVSSLTGIISTLAVNGSGVYYLAGTNPEAVSINGPQGVFLDPWGNLYFADTLNNAIREIQSNAAVLNFTLTPVRQGEVSAPQPQTVENDGNQPWAPTGFIQDQNQNATVDAAGTTCVIGTQIAVDSQCIMSVEFSPSLLVPPTNPEIGDIDVASVAVNTPLDIIVAGDATAINSTTVTVSSDLNPAGCWNAGYLHSHGYNRRRDRPAYRRSHILCGRRSSFLRAHQLR